MERQQAWSELKSQCLVCDRCKLKEKRTQVVFGEGNLETPIVFVGEGPGEQEDLQGRPFVGPAGQLLTKMIEAMGLKREAVAILNIVKCRPPRNRTPEADEVAACLPWLREQIRIIKPRIIVCLGATAGKAIMDPAMRITRDRGQWVERKGFSLIATYHPSALLRDPAKKREAWEDLQKVRDRLG